MFAVSNGSDCYSAKNQAEFFENLKYSNNCAGENVFHAFMLLGMYAKLLMACEIRHEFLYIRFHFPRKFPEFSCVYFNKEVPMLNVELASIRIIVH